MKEHIIERARKHGILFLERGATIRSVSNKTTYSKSTIHLDLHKLKDINIDLYYRVMSKLNFNRTTMHIKGGENNRLKWERKKKNDNK